MADLLSMCANDLELNDVYEGDCLELLQDVETGSIHLAFADPPFNIGFEYDVYQDRRSADEYLTWCRQWMKELDRVLVEDGTFWLAIGDEFAAELKVLAQREIGFHCRSWVIWYYTFGVNCKRGFSRSHTHLFHFVKDPNQFKFNGENPAVRIPSARQLVYGDARANPKGRLPDNTWILRPQDAPEGGFSTEHDTWYYPRVAGTFKEREGFHGCQMPEQILGRIIRLCSDPGDVVLDPFAGSGTTMAVAKKLGRQWLGTELSSEYVQHVRRRLRDAHAGDSLDGAPNPLESAPKTGQRKRKSMRKKPPTAPALSELTEALTTLLREKFDSVPRLSLLLNPDQQEPFLKACRQVNKEIPSVQWNQALWSLTRKEQKLLQGLKAGHHQALFSVGSLDAFTPAAEAALGLVKRETGCSIQEVLCHPERAAEFDMMAERLAPDATPFELRWTAWVLLRQRARRSRRRVATSGNKTTARRLPKAYPLDTYEPARSLDVGVFILEGAGKETLYVGSTAELKSHLQRFQGPGWQHFNPLKVRWVREPHQTDLVQKELRERLSPSLNLG